MISNKIRKKQNRIQAGGSQGKSPEETGWNSEKQGLEIKIRKIKVNREDYYNTEQFPRGTRNQTSADS